ncbi:MAG: NAD(P)-dependent oxidoreductase [Chthoniobacterales bacterium]
MRERIGIVGVGRMGANMARRLKDTGWPVMAVHDIDFDSANALARELECPAVQSLPEVTAASDIVITVVTDDEAMRALFSDSDESLLAGADGTLFLNCATVSPAVHREVERVAAGVGAKTLEACMASSITQARDGSLYLMVGGNKGDFDRARPLLDDLSGSLRYVGPTGSAAEVKALVNMVMNINTAGLAEGLGLGDALGLDLQMLREVFSQTGANSRVLETDGEDMEKRDHACYFSAAHAAKDSGIALELGRAAGVVLPLAEATKGQYDGMVAAGLGELDKSGVAELTFKNRRPQTPG